jgi:sulfatase modifying factor 1
MRVLAAALLLIACSPPSIRRHVLVHLDTDAPLPAPDATRPGAARPLFDTLQVVVVDRDGHQVAGTERTTDLDAGMFSRGPLTFAVVPAREDERVLLQVTLFRRAHQATRFALADTDLSARFLLPAAADDGPTHASVFLGVERIGRHDGWDGKQEASVILSTESRIGSWPGAWSRPCASAPTADEVCVPGGAFWMGDPELRGNADLADSDRERLVVMSPFFLDRHEVTVEQFRRRWPDLTFFGFEAPLLFVPGDGQSSENFAAFTPEPTQPDDRAQRPVNGVTWATSNGYCAFEGKVLPTEAMFEYAASGAGNEWPYAWGLDTPACELAVVARAGVGAFAQYAGSCRLPGTLGGPTDVGWNERDRVSLDAGGQSVLVDLAGNVGEWTRDVFVDQASRPAQAGPLADPIEADERGVAPRRVVKGGSWRGGFVEARAGARADRYPDELNPSVGFRCARPDQPLTAPGRSSR